MSLNKWLAASIMTASLCGTQLAHAELYSGSLSYRPSGSCQSDDCLRVEGDWSRYTSVIQWWVTDEDPLSGFPWKYTYRFALTTKENKCGTKKLKNPICHLILEVSPESTMEDFTGFSGEAMPDLDDCVELQTVRSGNRGMPEDCWGICFVPTNKCEYDMTWTFWSNREPTWGDFYAQGSGCDLNCTYNYMKTRYSKKGVVKKGFVDPNRKDRILDDCDPDLPPWTDYRKLCHILRPDTCQVPEPSCMILLFGGAIGLACCCARRG